MKKLIADCTTGEVYERDFTQEELEQYEKDQVRLATEKAEAETKAQAKVDLLERLGITEDEAKLLLG
jgi:hypothetical protein